MNKQLVKNIIIELLAIVFILLLLVVVFYNKISIGRVIPKVESYTVSEEIKNELENEEIDESSEIVTTYELDASDLKSYEKTKVYNKGKKNPFAAEETSSTTNNNDNTTDENSNGDLEDNTDSSSTNFYEDDGTK